MFEKVEYSDVRFASIIVNYRGEASIKNRYFKTGRFVGKDAYVEPNAGSSIYDSLDARTLTRVYPENQKLFVSSDSKMPRALLRGSDYKIVMDKDKADIIVIPFPKTSFEWTGNLVVKSGSVLWLFSIQKAYGCSDNVIENASASISKELTEHLGAFDKSWSRRDYKPFNVYFLRKCKEYEDILNEDAYVLGKFCYDINVRFNPTTEINPENLEMLYRCQDKVIFEKALVGSEWQKYPFTICWLMLMKNDYYSRQSLSIVRDGIFWDDFNAKDGYASNRDIEPEDWNMCQRWLMYHFGLDEEKGGFMTYARFREIHSAFERNIFKNAVAIKPTFVNQALPAKELLNLVK